MIVLFFVKVRLIVLVPNLLMLKMPKLTCAPKFVYLLELHFYVLIS